MLSWLLRSVIILKFDLHLLLLKSLWKCPIKQLVLKFQHLTYSFWILRALNKILLQSSLTCMIYS